MISAFKLAYWTSSLIVLVISIAVIVVLAVQRTDIISRCATLNADETIDSCSVHYRNLMIILCCLIVVINLFPVSFIESNFISKFINLFTSFILLQQLVRMRHDYAERIFMQNFEIWKIILSHQVKPNSFKEKGKQIDIKNIHGRLS